MGAQVPAGGGRGRSFKQGAGGSTGPCRGREGAQLQAGSSMREHRSLLVEGEAQLQAGSRRREHRSPWVEGGGAASSTEQEVVKEGAQVTWVEGGGAA